ncbi:alpha/beta fold hydrolase [Halomicrococcus gelatinilyticus]|uniref:alpha/beta fold hydrolase n=1 Tax=Halomicrococcus gelatinilyticus TaxID=1702103 RepID=UPI002E145D7F
MSFQVDPERTHRPTPLLSDGDPLVLLHGLGTDHSMWRPPDEPYSRAGHRLLVPGARGGNT